ncbi:hypothetical protein HNO88_001571 [Novosphingobium chloroacetimidivorans]|uniref:Uncharacterized protein n=1 Tax=Novosphingobium chloroacetimidivorans TaxID=1428314 RepID=A0A7W7K8K8_9SPHN|nr:hypothetical protein [Novosphingobium chloroacetimidivorans]MBB4858252.1 hypothetical protein [Novosphingobium chloroacetimidivorans]
MLAAINAVIVLGYFVLMSLLLDHGTHSAEPQVRRLKFASLGVAFMCFGIGRMGYVPPPHDPDQWIFVMGHFAILLFGTIYFWTGYRDTHAEDKAGTRRQEEAKINALVRLVAKRIEEERD